MASVTSTAAPPRGRSRQDGRGRVLGAALDRVDRFPILEPARLRVMALLDRGAGTPEIAEAVESDVGLAIATLRAAALVPKGKTIASASAAVDALEPEDLAAALRAAPSYGAFERPPAGQTDPELFRLHSLMVQRAADAVADAAGSRDRDSLALAALLHDAGRLVMGRLHGGYAERFDRRLATPEERIAAERRELGIDHTLVGGVLSRRWGLSNDISTAIERHHNDSDGGLATMVRVGDMIAARLEGNPVDHHALIKTADGCGLKTEALEELLYDLPRGGRQTRRVSGPCPLSARELEVLRGLAEGKVYKQIAHDLSLSTSTVRSHLHNVYGKLGALDRAQAVLMATERGWL